tara:strand:+ start:239 stop:457 length:219 start_codon:yes stop_codon:yes gene_type:complete
MKIQKKYPRLFKALSQLYGARKAISLLKGLEEDFADSGCFIDQPYPSWSFTFSKSRLGHGYWAKMTWKHFGW